MGCGRPVLGCHKAPRGFAGRLPGSRHAISVADGVASRPKSELSLGVGSLSHAHYLIPKVVEALQHFLATMTVAGCPVRTALLVINSHRAAAGTPLLGLMHPASSLACAWRLRIVTWAAVCWSAQLQTLTLGVSGDKKPYGGGVAASVDAVNALLALWCSSNAVETLPGVACASEAHFRKPDMRVGGWCGCTRCRSGMGQGPPVLLPGQDASGWGTPFKQDKGTTRFQWSCPGLRVTYCHSMCHSVAHKDMICVRRK